MLVLLIFLFFRSLGIGCEVEDACPWQGGHVEEVHRLYFPGLASDRNNCIFRKLKSDGACVSSQASMYETSGTSSLPDSQLWSRCKHCAWDTTRDRFVIFKELNSSQHGQLIDLSWSSWGEFFHKHNDLLQAEVESVPLTTEEGKTSNEVSYLYVDRPVFIIPIITFHHGHLLVDVLEQVYGAMMKAYDRVRRDSLLIFDVANPEERRVLQEKLSVNSRYALFNPASRNERQPELLHDSQGTKISDTYGSSLEILTGLPILSREALNYVDRNGKQMRLLFSDVHVGLDSSSAFFQKGHRSHPCVWSDVHSSNFQFQQRKEEYTGFYEYVTSFYGRVDLARTDMRRARGGDEGLKLTIIQRADLSVRDEQDKESLPEGAPMSNRQILNLEQLLERARSIPRVSSRALVLEATPFTEQRTVFWDTDILMAVAGSALHNLLYLRRGSAVIILMQRGWGPWAWFYANQAKLLGMHVFVYFDDAETPTGLVSSHWSRRFWTHGPRGQKSANILLPEDVFEEILVKAVHEIDSLGSGTAGGASSPFSARTHHSEADLCLEGVHTFSRKRDSAQEMQRDDNREYGDGSEPQIRVVVTGIRATLVPDQGQWTISLSGNFEYGASSYMSEFLSSMPHLCLCVRALGTGSGTQRPPACVLLERFNYYANVKMHFGLESTVQLVHLWLQATLSGAKLAGSDAFLALDTRVSDGGWLLSHYVEEATGQGMPNPCQLTSISVTIPAEDNGGDVGTTEGVYILPLTAPLAFQRALTDLQEQQHLSPEICGRIVGAVSAKLLQCHIERHLPSVQHLPSPEAPFVFIHVEKTGGTTLREFITEAADRLALDYLVPCHGGVHCTVLDLSSLRETEQLAMLNNISVVAGHFSWGVWNQLPRYRGNEGIDFDHDWGGDGVTPPCLVMGRHPVDRAISYYYERCYDNQHCVGFRRRINDLTTEELLAISQQERNGKFSPEDLTNQTIIVLDEGMSDAACRAVTGRRATAGLKYRISSEEQGRGRDGGSTTELRIHGTGVPTPPALGADTLEIARKNTAKCVVGLQERWKDTQAVIDHWFPWMGGFAHDPERRKMHLYSGKEDRHSLRGDLKEALDSINPCDTGLYEYQVMLFEYQLEAMSGIT